MQGMTVISTSKELQEYTELLFKDISKALEMHAVLDEALIKPLMFRVSSDEDKAYITYSWMKIFTAFQEDVYGIIKKSLGRDLTSKEKTKLELKVYITKGSNLYEVVVGIQKIFADAVRIAESVEKMIPAQILSATVPLALAWMFGSYFKYRTNKHKLDVEAQKNKLAQEEEINRKKLESETLLETQRINLEQQQLIYEGQNKALDILGDILTTKENSEAKTARQLMRMPGNAKLEVAGREITQEDLEEIGKRKPRTVQESELVTIKGDFKTDVIVFPEGDSRKISISGMLDDGSPFRLDNIPVSKDFLTPEVYERINQGELVHWEFSMLRKGSKMESIILKNVMPVSDCSQGSDD